MKQSSKIVFDPTDLTVSSILNFALMTLAEYRVLASAGLQSYWKYVKIKQQELLKINVKLNI